MSYEKLDLHKMELKDLTDKNLWDGQWLETKYPYRFKKKTGIGAVLNTSFNLHGEPNVCSPYDAIKTFKNSGIKYLLIGNYLIEKY